MAEFPCGHKDHWTAITLAAHIPAEELDHAGMRVALGSGDQDGDWRVSDGEDCGGYAELGVHEVVQPADEGGEGGVASSVCHFSVNAARGAGGPTQLTYDALLKEVDRALSVDVEELAWTVVCDMVFPEETRWQLPILASPPQIAQDEKEFGRISLAGVTLDFSDSTIGLERVRLEGWLVPLPSQLKLMFRLTTPRSELSDVFCVVLSRAEELATLFIDFDRDDDNA